MDNWILPFCITMSYTVIAVILGVASRGKMDMGKMENWSVSGNTIGVVVSFFLAGASNISCYTFMGAPGWAYTKGVACFYTIIGLSLAAFFGYFVGPRVNRIAQKTKILTLAEGYGTRYDSKVLRSMTALVAGAATLMMAVIQIMGVGYILNVMSGGHVPFAAGAGFVLVAIFIYLFTSGIRAIGWTNVFQGILMFVLSITVCTVLLFKFHGGLNLSAVFTTVESISPEHLTLPGALGDMPPVYWTTSIMITMFAYWPGDWTCAASIKSPGHLRRSILFLPVYYIMMLPMMIVGFMCIYKLVGFSGGVDQAALSLVSQNLPLWLVGIFGAGVLASAQSTCEPQFHTTALTLTRDLILPNMKNPTPAKAGKLQRWMLLPLMFGVVLPLAVLQPTSMVYINLIAIGFVVQLMPLLLGLLLWPRSTKQGAFAGLAAGLVVVILFNFVWPTPLGCNPGVWGWIVNIPVHIIVSLCTQPTDRRILSKFFSEDLLNDFYQEESVEKE